MSGLRSRGQARLHRRRTRHRSQRRRPGKRSGRHSDTYSLACRLNHVLDAVFAEWGVQRVSSLEALVDTGILFDHFASPTGDRCGLMGVGGGISALLADAMDLGGLRLGSISETTKSKMREILPDSNASNPFDPGGWFLGKGGAPLLADAIELFGGDEGLDVLLYGIVPLSLIREEAFIEGIALGASRSDKPSICQFLHAPETEFRRRRFPECGIVELSCTDAAIEALSTWFGVAEAMPWALDQSDSRASAFAEDATTAFDLTDLPVGSATLLEDRAIGLLQKVGLRFPDIAVVDTPDEAARAAQAMGFPVVMKALAAGLSHRSRGRGRRWAQRSSRHLAGGGEGRLERPKGWGLRCSAFSPAAGRRGHRDDCRHAAGCSLRTGRARRTRRRLV